MMVWDSLFRPKELSGVLRVLDSEARMVVTAEAKVALGFAIVTPMVRQSLLEKSKAIAKAIQGGTRPRVLVYLAIVECCGSQLESGQYHTYRGILSMRGEALLALWKHAFKVLVQEGKTTPGEAASALEWIQERVKEAG